MAEQNRELILKSLVHELAKTHIELDGQNRTWKVYQARTDAEHGQVCLVTEYVYSTPTSTTIVGTKEVQGTWDSAFDADFTVSD